MRCEISGKEAPLYLVEIEGSPIYVAKEYTSLGKVLSTPGGSSDKRKPRFQKKRQSYIEKNESSTPVSNFSQLIRQAREKKGLTQQDASLKLNIKLSELQHLESAQLKPSLDIAKKFSSFYSLTLVEEDKREPVSFTRSSKSDVLTLGDMITIKKKKLK